MLVDNNSREITAANADGRNPFANLPRTEVLGGELRAGSARMALVAAGEATDGGPLFAHTENRFVPAQAQAIAGAHSLLCLLRQGGYLDKAIERGGTCRLSTESLRDLYEQLLDRVITCAPTLSRQRLHADLIAQEQIMPPFLGNGVAAPHAYSSTISERICLHAALDPPLAVAGVAEPVHTVYFIISPSGDPEGHLATLAEIARRHRRNEPA